LKRSGRSCVKFNRLWRSSLSTVTSSFSLRNLLRHYLYAVFTLWTDRHRGTDALPSEHGRQFLAVTADVSLMKVLTRSSLSSRLCWVSTSEMATATSAYRSVRVLSLAIRITVCDAVGGRLRRNFRWS
jgi:hypothetical protein